MGTFRNSVAALALWAALGLYAGTAHAAEASLTSPAAGGAMESRGVITLQVADSVSDARYANFFLQFDGDDITGLVAVNGRVVTYQPPAALSPGDHILLLVEKTGDNTFSEIARWSIHVGAGGGSGPVSAPAALSGAQEMGPPPAAANIGPPPPRTTGQVAGQYNYLLADNLEGSDKIKPHSGSATASIMTTQGGQNWQMDARANGLFDSRDKNNAPDEDHFLLGEYLVTTRLQNGDTATTINFGNHDAGLSNLLVDRFYRRGLSTRFDLGNTLRLTAFAQDPARAIGNSNVTGVARDGQRAEGGALRYFPLADSYGERVFVEAAGYYGEGTIAGDGAGVAADPENKGMGWTVAAEGQTRDDKINLRGDVAQTRFDQDGAGPLGFDRDEGYRMRLAWAPISTLLTTDASPERLQFATEYHRYGTFYRTLGNLLLPTDEQRAQVDAFYQKNTLALNGQTYVVENNVSRDPSLPVDRGRGVSVSGTVQPVFFSPGIDAGSFLGRSTWNAGAMLSRETRHETPAGFAGDGLNQTTFTANGGWSLAFDKVTGTLSHTYTDFNSNATPLNSYTLNFSELALTWLVNDRLSVTPSAQMQVQHETLRDVTTRQYVLALDTSTIIIPDKLSNTLHYGTLLDDGSALEDTHSASTEFVWQLKPAAINDPGVALALSGYYDHQPRDTLLPLAIGREENYKVFLSLKIASPFGF